MWNSEPTTRPAGSGTSAIPASSPSAGLKFPPGCEPARQSQAEDRQVDEIRTRVRCSVRLVEPADHYPLLLVTPSVANLLDGDGHHPRAETLGIAELLEAVHDLQHRFLHHVVHVEVAVQGP